MLRSFALVPLLVLALGGTAWSQPNKPEARVRRGFTHDGFHMSAALGGGGLSDSFAGPFGWGDAQATGGSGAGELIVAIGLREGLFLGGGVFVDWVQSPTIEADGEPVDHDVDLGVLAIVGPVVDWYPRPTGSFHLVAGAGAARITVTDESGERKSHEPLGAGAVVAAGWDFWLSPHWTFGVRARVTGATLLDEGVTHRVAAGAALLSLGWN